MRRALLAYRAFTADVSELRGISAWWRDWAASEGLGEEATYGGDLCLNEAVANIILHGCGDGALHEVAITFERLEGRVRMTLADDGRAFNPLEYPVPPLAATLEEVPVGGFGVFLIRTYATEVRYRFDNGHNVLTLILRG